MEKIEELKQFLKEQGEDGEVKQSSYDTNLFETEDGREYLVLTDEEADEYTYDDIESFIDDVGLKGFTENFQTDILQNGLDSDWVSEAFRDEMYYRVEDMEDDELLDELKSHGLVGDDASVEDIEEDRDSLKEQLVDAYVEDDYDSDGLKVDYFIDIMGQNAFLDLVTNQNAYDIDYIVDECIKWDGRGHFLARYDGAEEETENYYIYRAN